MAIRLGAVTDKDEGIEITGGLGYKLGSILLDLAVVKADNLGTYLTASYKF